MPSPSDLVTLAEVQAYIGQAANNGAKVGMIITAVSAAIRRMTDCVILPTSFTETYDGSPFGVMLRNWPIISVDSVTIRPCGFGGTMALQPSVNGSRGYSIEVAGDPQASTPQMLTAPPGVFFKGSQNVTVSYRAGFQVSGEAATVPAGGGTVTVQQPSGAWGSDQGVSYATGGALQSVSGTPGQGQYSVAAGGVYTFSAADAGASLLISYGYVPADLANAAMEWIADRLAYQDRIGVASKSLGGQETTSYRISQVPAFVTALLQPFTNVVPIG